MTKHHTVPKDHKMQYCLMLKENLNKVVELEYLSKPK